MHIMHLADFIYVFLPSSVGDVLTFGVVFTEDVLRVNVSA